MESIESWKEKQEKELPINMKVIARNKAISAQYARLYQEAPQWYKWAGMAAFASHHVGLALAPLSINKRQIKEVIDLQRENERGWQDDLNLLRILNNSIYDDISWVHRAYLNPDFGIEGLRKILQDHPHYQDILEAFEILDQGRQELESGNVKTGNDLIWKANVQILHHEQFEVVQPVFQRLNLGFTRVLSFCASLDFDAKHTKTDWKTHSSFFWFTLFQGTRQMMASKGFPNLISLDQRWTWIERSLVPNWRKTEQYDKKLKSKIQRIIDESKAVLNPKSL